MILWGDVMGRDLSFWKYAKGFYLDNQDVYKKLSEGAFVEGLEALPISKILNDITTAFRDWKKESDVDFQGKCGAFQIFTTEQFVRIDCYSISEDDMNRIVDILFEYDCPLYDSQISERFDGCG